MTEMIVSQFNIGSILKSVLLNVVALALFWFILNLNKKRRRFKPSKNVIKLLFLFFVLLITLINSILFSYTFDYIFNNITKKVINLDDLSARNHIICYIDDQNNTYYFDIDRDKSEELEDYFVGHDCEIEYYKWSKMVTKIKLTD